MTDREKEELLLVNLFVDFIEDLERLDLVAEVEKLGEEPKFLLYSREALHFMIENPMKVLEIVGTGGSNRVRFNDKNNTFQWFDYHLEQFLTLERLGKVLNNTWKVLD